MKTVRANTFMRVRDAAGLRTVSRRKVTEFLKTLLIVVPLTLLIWIYAEREQATSDELRDVPLAFVLGNPALTATITEPVNGTVTVGLFGPRGQIDQLKAKLEGETQGHRLQLTLPIAYSGVGDKSVDLVRLLNDDPLIASSGVTVMREGTNPAQVKVTVDDLVVRDVTVIRPRDDGPQGLAHVTFDPPKVTFRGPAAAMAGQFPGDAASVAVDLASVNSELTVGNHTVDVPLSLPRDPRIIADASRVKMTFDLASQEMTVTLRNVSIDVRRPIGQDGRSKVIIKGGLLHNVRIRGPEGEIKRYAGDNPEQLLTAVLTVTGADVGGSGLKREVKYPDLPPDVSVVESPDAEFDVRDAKDVSSDPDR